MNASTPQRPDLSGLVSIAITSLTPSPAEDAPTVATADVVLTINARALPIGGVRVERGPDGLGARTPLGPGGGRLPPLLEAMVAEVVLAEASAKGVA